MAYELDARGTQGREAEGGITPSPRRVRGSPKAHRAAWGTNFNETERSKSEMSKEEEKVLNVPLKPEVRKLLDARADDNGRAASREAASIIESAVKPKDAE